MQDGKALRSEIQKLVSDYKANVAKTFGEENAREILDWALRQAKFRVDLTRYVPAFLDGAELRRRNRSGSVARRSRSGQSY